MNEQTWIDREIGPRVVGGTYHCGYWDETYTVEAIWRAPDASQWGMRVRWSDGRATIHSTGWDAERDSVVETATVPAKRCDCRPDCIAINRGCPCDCHGAMQVQCSYIGGYLHMETVPERAPAGMLVVRVGSDPWTMIPLDEATNPVGWDVIDTSTD